MKIIEPSVEERKSKAKERLLAEIERLYGKDEELRLVNLGLSNQSDPEYVAYRAKIDELLNSYRSEWQ